MKNNTQISGVTRKLKNVYFVQANYLFGNNAHLPYAVGCIAAYAWKNSAINQNYRLGRFIYTREPLSEALKSLEDPYIVAFSCYVWNMEYNKALAKKIKESYPDCLIVFGGHQVAVDDASLLRELPFVDYLTHGAGEVPTEQLLLALNNNKDLRGVSNLSFRLGDEIISNPMVFRDPTHFPSPYLSGIFDRLYETSPYEFSMSFETNRGCPFHCAFCDWGTLHGKIYEIPMERIEAEIAWAAEHKTDLLYCVDANFGVLPRDTEIADKIIASKLSTGYPNKFRACYTKNSDETVFELNEKLNRHGMSKGATLSFQSVEPDVLKNIGRKNLTLPRFKELMTLYNSAGIPTDSELILGLPGETLESFERGVGKLLEAGQHHSLDVYLCEMFPNARLSSKEERDKHGIECLMAPMRRDHCAASDSEEIIERCEIICRTNTMSRADWKQANLFALLVQGLHCCGATQLLAMYAYYELGIAYDIFYKKMLDWAQRNPEGVLGEIISMFDRGFDELLEGRGERAYVNRFFGDLTWPLEEGLFLETVARIDDFYKEIACLIKELGVQADILEELLRYQSAVLKKPRKSAQTLSFRYDFVDYYEALYAQNPRMLKKGSRAVNIPDTTDISWEDYARENVWYGRRGGSNIYRSKDLR